jgi:hypothetical protein
VSLSKRFTFSHLLLTVVALIGLRIAIGDDWWATPDENATSSCVLFGTMLVALFFPFVWFASFSGLASLDSELNVAILISAILMNSAIVGYTLGGIVRGVHRLYLKTKKPCRSAER